MSAPMSRPPIDAFPGGTILTGVGIEWFRIAQAVSLAGLDLKSDGVIKFRQTRVAWIILALWIDQPTPRSRKQKAALYRLVSPSFPHLYQHP